MSKTRTLSDLVQTEGAITPPSGTTAERPANPAPGQQRFNTDTGFTEVYNPLYEGWQSVAEPFVIQATGGTVTDITQNGKQYRVHTFTSSGTFEVVGGTGDLEYLVIAGGGGGFSGGGGAGGYRSSVEGELSGQNTPAEPKINITGFTVLPVVVGSGGLDSPSPGGDSSLGSIVSIGGGEGGQRNITGGDGGSGGGEASRNPAGFGSGTTGQGFDGGVGLISPRYGAGGGGAGQIGGDATSARPGIGGDGITSEITGSAVTRAGGGGGRDSADNTLPAIPGAGGGGVPNSGSGGSDINDGGSGIVIVRYRIG